MIELTDLLGVPFVPGGRSSRGYDCWGLVCEVYNRLGRDIPQLSSDQHQADTLHDVYLSLSDSLRRIDDPVDWCIIAFRLHPKFITHAGVMLPRCHQFIHIMYRQSVSIQSLSHPLWQRRIEGYYICQG